MWRPVRLYQPNQVRLVETSEPHSGSIDVDLTLNTDKLNGGWYAELLYLLLDTRPCVPGAKGFNSWRRWIRVTGEPARTTRRAGIISAKLRLKDDTPADKLCR